MPVCTALVSYNPRLSDPARKRVPGADIWRVVLCFNGVLYGVCMTSHKPRRLSLTGCSTHETQDSPGLVRYESALVLHGSRALFHRCYESLMQKMVIVRVGIRVRKHMVMSVAGMPRFYVDRPGLVPDASQASRIPNSRSIGEHHYSLQIISLQHDWSTANDNFSRAMKGHHF
jgi:hypothetical protein